MDLHSLRWLQTEKLRFRTAEAVEAAGAVEAAEAAEGLLPSGGHISPPVY